MDTKQSMPGESGRVGYAEGGAAVQYATAPERDISQLDVLHNGPGAAAILAAGIGSLALGVFAFAGDASPPILHAFNYWQPTGPLSGVTSTAVIVWLLAWYLLARRWSRRSVNLMAVNIASFTMLIAGLLLTFPPFMDLLQGK
jgi:hypothetical protein